MVVLTNRFFAPHAGALAAALLLSTGLWAGAALAQSSGTEAASDATAETEAPGPDMVVATVNGEEIVLGELEIQYQNLPQQYQQAPMQMLFPQLMSLAIDNKLLSNQATAAGLEEDEEVQRILAIAKQQVLREYYLARLVEEGVTAETIQARYDEMAAEPGFSFEEMRARHILVEEEETAKAIIEELDGGADFAELAKEKSTGPSGPRGGDLGYFQRGQMVPVFEAAALALEPGNYSAEPVKSDFGWHVILLEDKRFNTPSLEETEPQIRDELSRELITAELATLRADADIERFGLDGEPLDDGSEADASDSEEEAEATE